MLTPHGYHLFTSNMYDAYRVGLINYVYTHVGAALLVYPYEIRVGGSRPYKVPTS